MTNKRIALLFAGQGAQQVGMGGFQLRPFTLGLFLRFDRRDLDFVSAVLGRRRGGRLSRGRHSRRLRLGDRLGEREAGETKNTREQDEAADDHPGILAVALPGGALRNPPVKAARCP